MHLLPAVAPRPGLRSRWPASCGTATWAGACSWRNGWPTCTTSTRSTAATGSPPGRRAATCCPVAGAPPTCTAARRPALAGRAVARRAGRARCRRAQRRPHRSCTSVSSRRSRRTDRAAGLAGRAPRDPLRHDARADADACRRWPRCGGPHPGADGRSPTRAATTGPTSSKGRDAAAPVAPPPSAARAPRPRGGAARRHARCTATRCSPRGAGRAATSCASSTPSTTRRPRSTASPSPAIDLFDEERRQHAAGTRCRANIRDLVPLHEHPAHAGAMRTTARSSSTSRTAASARWRCCTTSCWRCSPAPGDTPLHPRDIVVMVPDVADPRACHPRRVRPVRRARDARVHPVRHRRRERPRHQPAAWWRVDMAACACRRSAAA